MNITGKELRFLVDVLGDPTDLDHHEKEHGIDGYELYKRMAKEADHETALEKIQR